jgi:formamidopyrimidine-DNA glycosylase
MPELPGVEVFKRYMDATSLHQKIRSVGVRNEKIPGDVSAHTLQSTLKGPPLGSPVATATTSSVRRVGL